MILRLQRLTLLGIALMTLPTAAVQAQATRNLLNTALNPQYHENQKTMGLLQRNFLDLVEDGGNKLQLALVIDATDSMGDDLKGVRDAIENMITDLERYRGKGNVSVSIVLYRDVDAKSGPVTFLTRGFVNDAALLKDAMSKVQPEEGEPYFYEVPDKGIHDAITKLPWDEDEQTTKWIFVFGDAPPYDVTFVDTEPNGKAQRFFDTLVITNAAKKRNIKISCVLCTSRDYDKEVYQELLPKTRRFMSDLSSGTGGLMLDLSYPDIQKALQETAKEPRVSVAPIPQIRQEEVDIVRRIADEQKQLVATNRRQRVAVLPFQPFNRMDFDINRKEVLVATELRHYMRRLPGFQVRTPMDVDRAVRSLQRAKLNDADFLRRLAQRLRVTMIVYGNILPSQGVIKANAYVYSAKSGKSIGPATVTVDSASGQIQLVTRLTDKMRSTIMSSGTRDAGPLVLAGAQTSSEITRVADTVEEHSLILKALESLERALEYAAGSKDAQEHLTTGEAALTDLRKKIEFKNDPFVNQLLASCYYNQATFLRKTGKPDEAKKKLSLVRQRLINAFGDRNRAAFDGVKQEIVGDYALLITKDHKRAIDTFEALTRAQTNPSLQLRRRAHWMLYGIYSGDWGTPKDFHNPGKAKQQALQILAHWPESPEAKFIKQALRYSDRDGETKYGHVPQSNNELVGAIEREDE